MHLTIHKDKQLKYTNFKTVIFPGAPLTHFNDWGGGGGGGLSDFFGSEILAQSDFFVSMKDARIFLGRKEKQEVFWVAKKGLLKGFFWVC